MFEALGGNVLTVPAQGSALVRDGGDWRPSGTPGFWVKPLVEDDALRGAGRLRIGHDPLGFPSFGSPFIRQTHALHDDRNRIRRNVGRRSSIRHRGILRQPGWPRNSKPLQILDFATVFSLPRPPAFAIIERSVKWYDEGSKHD